MWLASMRCPKCGLIQRQSATCKACGTAVSGDQVLSPGPAPAQMKRAAPPTPSAPPPPEAQQKPFPTGTLPGEARRLFFHGAEGSLFGIQIVNMFLSLLTLGFYSFWGKVKIRRYLMSQTEFEGDRFAYHGTGKELLIGSLKAGLVFGVPIALLNILPTLLGGGAVLTIISGLLIYNIIMVFIPFATVGARRYRLSRTSWRGVRFSFRGRVLDFIKLFITGSFLTTITLGLYYPFFDTKRYDFLVSNSYFGNQRFRFDGNGRDLFTSYLLALLLSVITLGFYWFWFLAKKQRYLTEHTSFASARFRSTVTGSRLLVLMLGNFLLLSAPLILALIAAAGVLLLLGLGQGFQETVAILAAGGKELWLTIGAGAVAGFVGWFLSWSFITLRNMRFAMAYLTLDGPLDLAPIQQEAQTASATAEGLAGFLDMDLDLG